MSSKLYFLSGGAASMMSEVRYEQEADLQKILEDNPDLVLRSPGSGEDELFLIMREKEVQAKETSFSLDHLMVDQDGVPVLVEVKRSSDTRIRREVVGQMLDYAARVTAWDVRELRQQFVQSNQGRQMVLDAYDTDEFWARVADNLRAEKIKLVFVADAIPETLRIIIDFMDRQMPNIEVYGVEVHQYKSGDATLLSTNVIGSAMADIQKVEQESRMWDLDSFCDRVRELGGEELVQAFTAFYDRLLSIGYTGAFGSGAKYGRVMIRYGKKTIFWINHTPQKCSIEIGVDDLAKLLGGERSVEELETMLLDFPTPEIRDSEYVFLSEKHNLIIDIRLLLMAGAMDALLDNFAQLYRLLEAALPPSPTYKTWDEDGLLQFVSDHGYAAAVPVIQNILAFTDSLGLQRAYGHGKFYPSCSVKLGSRTLFVANTWMKDGYSPCVADFYIPDLVAALGDGWDEQRVRSFLSTLPAQVDVKPDGMTWDTSKYTYVNFAALTAEENFSWFQQVIKTLVQAIGGTGTD